MIMRAARPFYVISLMMGECAHIPTRNSCSESLMQKYLELKPQKRLTKERIGVD